MEQQPFRKMLLRSAAYAMAFDGEVHASEVSAIKEMASEAAYFADLDAEPEALSALDAVRSSGEEVIEDFFGELSEASFSSEQEVLVYEVLLRVMQADGEFHSDERYFLQRVRESLQTEDRTLIVNFPTHLADLLDKEKAKRHGFSDISELSNFRISDEALLGGDETT